MDFWNKATLKSLALPGGVIFLTAAILLESGALTISASAADFFYYAVFGAGVLLAWRFHSSRVLFALITLLLAHRALEFFSGGHASPAGPGRIAFEGIALLLPLNFLALSFMRERGLTIPAAAPRVGLLFIESVVVAVLCRPGSMAGPALLHPGFLNSHLLPWLRVPQFSVLAFIAAFALLLIRFLLYRKPVESGLLWALGATFLALQSGGIGRTASVYVATAGLILVSSIIENSYVLAYHDELTTLPARRAFNDALLRLQEPYTIAVVDIDHFKKFNDTYGHETGDQVLRMVATRLARVTAGGQAFRVGGEEFSILFPGKSMNDVSEHLELLRTAIASSTFSVRGGIERRKAPARGPDRRTRGRKKSSSRRAAKSGAGKEFYSKDLFGNDLSSAGQPSVEHHELSANELSVTVSIGVAEPTARTNDIEDVIQAADKALYRAKRAGRNRVEAAAPSRPRPKRSIA